MTVLDCMTEMLLLGLPVQLVWALHVRPAKKAMIVAAFWVRLPYVVRVGCSDCCVNTHSPCRTLGFSIARNHYTLQLNRQQSDAGLDSALTTIWVEIELAFAIAAR